MNEKERDLYAAIHKEQARSEREILPPDPSCFEDFVTRFKETYKKEESTSQKKPVDFPWRQSKLMSINSVHDKVYDKVHVFVN